MQGGDGQHARGDGHSAGAMGSMQKVMGIMQGGDGQHASGNGQRARGTWEHSLP